MTTQRPDAPATPRAEPCCFVNPALWSYFCAQVPRDSGPSLTWSEADVIQWLDEKNYAQRRNATYRMFDSILHPSERANRPWW
jgi:hypothetical protein